MQSHHCIMDVLFLNVLFLSCSVLVGCWWPEGAVSPQSDPVSRKPISVAQRPGRIPKPSSDCARGWAHTQQLCSRSVKLTLYLVLEKIRKKVLCTFSIAQTDCWYWHNNQRTLLISSPLFVPRLPILSYRKRAEGRDQRSHRTLRWHSARFIRPLCLYYAQGAGQTVR